MERATGGGGANGREEPTRRAEPERVEARPAADTAAANGTPGRSLLRLQRQAGNRAVVAHLQRVGMHDSFRPPPAAPDNNAELVRRAVETRDISDIKAVRDYRSVSRDDRIDFLTRILNQGWVGPYDEAACERIWDSFGAGLAQVANDEHELWSKGIDKGVDPSRIRAADLVRRNFEADVKAVARGYLNRNLEFADAEMQRLGLEQGAGPASPTADLEAQLRMESTQDLAAEAERALTAQDAMRSMIVGYRSVNRGDGIGYEPVTFDPNARGGPASTSMPWGGGQVSRTWDQVKEQWDRTEAVLAGVGAQSPTVYAALAADRSQVRTLATASPQQARQTAGQVLGQLRTNIRTTIPKLSTGDLDWRDLSPIHQQLYRGDSRGASGTNWTTPFAKGVAEDTIGDHETTEFWVSLGVGTAAAALFIVAEIATGGLATAALLGGIAVGGAQAARSWENYDDLATAAETAASDDTRLVSRGQVDAARMAAILDTVFLALDIAAPAIRAGRAALAARQLEEAVTSRGAASALEAAFRQGAEAGPQSAAAVERGVMELGVEETMRRSGRNAADLRSMLPEASAARARLDSAIAMGLRQADDAARPAVLTVAEGAAEQAWMQGKPLRQLVGELPDAIKGGQVSRALGERLTQEAIERLGPSQALEAAGGWKVLSQALGDQSQAGSRLMAWRTAVFDDLERYVREELRGTVQRTGTQRAFSNDIDMSFTGANAAAVKEQASAYLARRLGVENTPDAFDRMMMAGLFTDPRRMHAYDALPATLREEIARRQAAKEEQLIWNRRLWEASSHNDEALAGSVREQMRQLGVPEFSYRPLTEADRARLGQRIDALHADLDRALAAGDTAAQTRAVEQMADAQALINAAEGGGYFSGGGVRRYVSERPGEAGFNRLGNAGAPAASAERLTRIIDQLPKLDHSFLDLASGSTERIVGGVRGIGKYGQRLAEVTAEAGVHNDEAWAALVRRCAELKEAADSGRTATRLGTEAGEVIAEARRLFTDLVAKHGETMAQVRRAAELPGIGNAAARIQFMTTAHVRLLRAVDWSLQNLNVLARAARTGTPLSDLPEGDHTGSLRGTMGDFPTAPAATQPGAAVPA